MKEGGCSCGFVRYRADGTPSHETNCHCTICRRTSGAPFVSWFTVPASGFRVTAGEPASFRSSAHGTRTFCPRCGTPLTFQSDQAAGEIDVTTCSLDAPELVPPRDHTWASSKLPWVRLGDRLPSFPEARSRGQGGEALPDLLVNIDVGDLERALAFYTEGLGLELGRRLGPDIAELRGASCLVYLTRHAPGSRPFAEAASPRAFGRHWTPVHLDFVVSDLSPAIRRAESAGAMREGEIRDFEWGRYLVMADPFGNGFCILQFKGRGYAEIASTER